jgi:hypothetical protein
VLELPYPRFRREPRLRLVGRRGHGRQRRRCGVARRVHELAGSRPLPSRPLSPRPLLRFVDAARGPVRSPGCAVSSLPGLADLARLERRRRGLFLGRLARWVKWLRVHGPKLSYLGQRRNRCRWIRISAGREAHPMLAWGTVRSRLGRSGSSLEDDARRRIRPAPVRQSLNPSASPSRSRRRVPRKRINHVAWRAPESVRGRQLLSSQRVLASHAACQASRGCRRASGSPTGMRDSAAWLPATPRGSTTD